MHRIVFIIALALTLAGCPKGGIPTIENPVTEVNIYQVENAYAAALQLAASYREYCWKTTYAVLMTDPVARPICQRRHRIYVKIQQLRPKAAFAISEAKGFIARNPTLSASTVVSEAWRAVTAFHNAVPVTQ